MDIEVAREELEQLIAEHGTLAHLGVKKYGKSLIIRSDTSQGEQKHARLTHLGGAQWGLSFPLHLGRWERSPFAGSLPELWETLTTNFPFYLEHA